MANLAFSGEGLGVVRFVVGDDLAFWGQGSGVGAGSGVVMFAVVADRPFLGQGSGVISLMG